MNEPKDIERTIGKQLLFVGLDVHAKNLTMSQAKRGAAHGEDSSMGSRERLPQAQAAGSCWAKMRL